MTVFFEKTCTIWRSTEHLFLNLKNCHWKVVFDVSFGQSCSFAWILCLILWECQQGAKAVWSYSMRTMECDSTAQSLGSWMVCTWVCIQKNLSMPNNLFTSLLSLYIGAGGVGWGWGLIWFLCF